MFHARHRVTATHQRFSPMTGIVAWRFATIADLNPPAVHHHARHLRNLIDGTLLLCGQRKRLVRGGQRLGLLDALRPDSLRPALHALAGDLDFGQRFQILSRLDERRPEYVTLRSRAGVNGQSTSTPITLVSGKKSLAAARAEVLRLGDGHRPSAAKQFPLPLALIAA